MAHMLTLNDSSQTAYAEQAFADKPNGIAWHKLGTQYDRLVTSVEAREHTRVDLELVPLMTPNGSPVANHFAIQRKVDVYNEGYGRILDVVGGNYGLLSHDDFYDKAKLLAGLVSQYANGSPIGDNDPAFASAMTLRDGRETIVTIPIGDMTVDSGHTKFHVTLVERRGGLAAIGYLSAIRVVCWNTFNASLLDCESKRKARHNVAIVDNVDTMVKLLAESVKSMKRFKEWYKVAESTKISNDDVQRVFHALIAGTGLPSGELPELKGKNLANFQRLNESYQNGLGALVGTHAGVFEGVTNYTSHVIKVKRHGETTDLEARFLSNQLGAGSKLNERVPELLASLN